MNKATLQTIANEIELALQTVAKKHNVQIRSGNGTYTSTSASLKLEISDVVGGVVERKERTDFIQMAKFYELSADMLDKEVSFGGKTFTIAGLRSRATKNNIEIKEVRTGKMFVCRASQIKSALMLQGK